MLTQTRTYVRGSALSRGKGLGLRTLSQNHISALVHNLSFLIPSAQPGYASATLRFSPITITPAQDLTKPELQRYLIPSILGRFSWHVPLSKPYSGTQVATGQVSNLGLQNIIELPSTQHVLPFSLLPLQSLKSGVRPLDIPWPTQVIQTILYSEGVTSYYSLIGRNPGAGEMAQQ